nr:uncharacterized protein LOC124813613 [Hydra vulgaris]
MNHNSRGRKIMELLKSSKKDSTTEPNHTNSKDVENEEDNGDDLRFDEDNDDSDPDKNYETASSETDSSDDVPVLNEIQNEVSRNKTSAKTNSNGHELRLLEEDLNLIAENQVGLDLQGTVGVRRKVKNKSISTDK